MNVARLEDAYEIVRPIGRGATGVVYEARAKGSGERVAVKWMHARPFDPEDPDLRRFAREARIAGALGSPHVVRVLDLALDEATRVPFLVMEHLAGEDLGALLSRAGALSPDTALRVAAQACEGLAAAHEARVIHRDIKPANLFLARGDGGAVTVKLLDFGVAKIRRGAPGEAMSPAISAHARSLTVSGEVLGTPLFMAPEQIDGGKRAGPESDVFSLGVVLYTMLRGAAPHAEKRSIVALLAAVLREPAPPLAKVAPGVPRELATLVEKAMSKSREDRFPDAREMLAALRSLLRGGDRLDVSALGPPSS